LFLQKYKIAILIYYKQIKLQQQEIIFKKDLIQILNSLNNKAKSC